MGRFADGNGHQLFSKAFLIPDIGPQFLKHSFFSPIFFALLVPSKCPFFYAYPFHSPHIFFPMRFGLSVRTHGGGEAGRKAGIGGAPRQADRHPAGRKGTPAAILPQFRPFAGPVRA
jgi:hypothetical protein